MDQHEPRPRVLIVDDDWLVRNTLAEILQSEGYAVEAARNEARAAHRAGSWRPDVILLDMPEPPLDRSGFVREYRRFDAPRAPIVIMTTTAAAPAAARAGLAPVLTKPFDLDDVLAAIRHATDPLGLGRVAA